MIKNKTQSIFTLSFISYFSICKVYYTHAYSVQEKGTNERFNGMLRKFLPRGRSINDITEKESNQMATKEGFRV